MYVINIMFVRSLKKKKKNIMFVRVKLDSNLLNNVSNLNFVNGKNYVVDKRDSTIDEYVLQLRLITDKTGE